LIDIDVVVIVIVDEASAGRRTRVCERPGSSNAACERSCPTPSPTNQINSTNNADRFRITVLFQ